MLGYRGGGYVANDIIHPQFVKWLYVYFFVVLNKIQWCHQHWIKRWGYVPMWALKPYMRVIYIIDGEMAIWVFGLQILVWLWFQISPRFISMWWGGLYGSYVWSCKVDPMRQELVTNAGLTERPLDSSELVFVCARKVRHRNRVTWRVSWHTIDIWT